MIALALDGPPGDGSFVDSAVAAANGFVAAGASIITLEQPSLDDIDPTWTAVFAHGSSLTDWAHTAAQRGIRTVLSDLPPNPLGEPHMHYVDWAWDAGLAEVTRRILAADGSVAALLTGPDFPPQQRIEAAVREAMASAGAPPPHVVQAGSFADLSEVPGLVSRLLDVTGPGAHVISSAGPLGEAVSRELREQSRITHGITRRDPGHMLRVASDVQGAVEHLLAALVTGDPLLPVTRCDVASGLQQINGDVPAA